MAELREELEREAAARREAGLARRLALPAGLDFCSNDYLGLSQDPRVVEAAVDAARAFGAGAPSARLLRGHLALHEEAEREAAHWTGEEAALLFPSGYQANLALIGALAGPEDVVLSDRLNHASLIDGVRLSRAQRRILPHLDLSAYADALAGAAGARRRLVVVEDVYSMDGDRAPLAGLLDLCEQHDAWLIVDSAHAAGLLPFRGGGHPRLAARVLTGGKALGVGGAFVCGSAALRQHLIDHGRSFIYTTAVAPPVAAALTAAMRVVQIEPERAATALARAEQLRTRLREGKVDAGGEAAIVPVVLGESARAMTVAAGLQEAGFDVRAVRPPTVPEGSSRLRLVTHADHSEEEVDALAATLLKLLAQEGHARFLTELPEVPDAPMLAVAGTDTDVGKTVVSALLARALARKRITFRYLKPMQTGDDLDTPEVMRLADLPAKNVLEPLAQLPLPASVDQAAAAAGVRIEMRELLAGMRARRQEAGRAGARLLLECAGGLRVPINERADQLDFLQALRVPLVMVARSGLGTLNHTLLSLEACAARGIPVQALFLVGETHAANVASLRDRLGTLPILEVPPFRTLDTQSLDLWLNTEDLSFLDEMETPA
jgi:8-amino-7-oxononanoate synthase